MTEEDVNRTLLRVFSYRLIYTKNHKVKFVFICQFSVICPLLSVFDFDCLPFNVLFYILFLVLF